MAVRRGVARIEGNVLVLQGSRDRVVSPRATAWLCDRLASANMEFRFYPDLGHDLKLEPEMPMVASDIVEWMSTAAQSDSR